MSTFILAPEPVDWLGGLLARAHELGEGPLAVLAPWATGARLAALARLLPARARLALERRRVDAGAARILSHPAWLALDAGLAAWAGRDAGRRISARFAFRRAAGALAARVLPPDARTVIAPTGAAERLFARAPSLTRILVMDLPCLRRLHLDLDEASLRHPDATFLRRFRAPGRDIARQEAEWALATRILVRSAYAHGVIGDGVQFLSFRPTTGRLIHRPSPKTEKLNSVPSVFLAGGGAARGGSYEALAALDALPEVTMVVVPGEGMEPRGLMEHQRVRVATHAERERLAGVGVVIAPAWCEQQPRELVLARALGVPRIATPQAAGPGDVIVPRGDAGALAVALSEIYDCWRAETGRPMGQDTPVPPRPQ